MRWCNGTAAAAAFACALASPPAASAQALRDQCADASRAAVLEFCQNVADAAVIMQPRIGIALSGGNPVPGTASTMGMRLGALPRMSLGLRVTAARLDLPPSERIGETGDVRASVGSISADVSLGVFQGISLLPTVGGFGSLDLLASVGILPLPRGEGFDDSSPATWAVGARVGILRESFTAPGVSVSAMYRGLGRTSYGSADLSDRDAFIQMSGYAVTSLRATVGKRVLGYGLTAGIAHDRYSADVVARVRDPVVLDPTRVLTLTASGMSANRTAFFGNAALTILILNLVTELGWQQGGAGMEAATEKLERGGLFGGVAVRLAI
jgi:hypothetical protein